MFKETREKFYQEIDSLISDERLPNLSLSNSLFKPINFELSYDGKDNLAINTKLTKLYKKIYPEIENFKIETSKKNEKITIINSTHNKNDFDYDYELKISVEQNKREFKLI